MSALQMTTMADALGEYATAMDDLTVKSAQYDEACDVGLAAAQDCYDYALDCSDEANKFNEAGQTYMFNPAAESDCYDTLATCTNYMDEETADSEKCFTCYRWTLYYAMSVEGPDATIADLDRGCTDLDNDRADCYEWFSAESCSAAVDACTLSWDSQCIYNRDNVWQSWQSACNLYDDYVLAAGDLDVTIYDACEADDTDCINFADYTIANCMCDPADDDCTDYSAMMFTSETALFGRSIRGSDGDASAEEMVSSAALAGGVVALVAAFAAGRASKRAPAYTSL